MRQRSLGAQGRARDTETEALKGYPAKQLIWGLIEGNTYLSREGREPRLNLSRGFEEMREIYTKRCRILEFHLPRLE